MIMSNNTHISHLIGDYKNTKSYNNDLLELGVREIDNAIQGLEAGEMITLLGDPGSGKTSLTIRMVDSLSVDRKIPTLYMCVRNAPSYIIRRLVDYRRSSEDDEENVIKEITNAPIYLHASHSMNMDDVYHVCRQHVEEYGVKVVFIHYLYIAYDRDNAYRLRLLAKELGISIVVLVNIFEYREGIEGVLPFMRDLYDNLLGEYSDTVIGFCDYAAYHTTIDTSGHNISGLLHVSILKCHGEIQDNRFYVSKDSMHHKQLTMER